MTRISIKQKKLKEFLQSCSRKEQLEILAKATLSTFSFTGGVSQIWSDIESKKKDKKLSEVLDYLLQYFESPEQEKDEVKKLLAAKINDLQTDLNSSNSDEFSVLLREILLENIPKQLRSIRIDGIQGLDKAIDIFRSKPIISNELSKSSNFYEDLNRIRALTKRRVSSTLGINRYNSHLDRYLKDSSFEINIAFTPIMLAVSAIFFHLKYIRKFNINLDFSYIHALELAERIVDRSVQRIHACVLGDAPSIN